MSLIKKIVGQSSVYFLGTVLAVVVGFFFKVYLSRTLGADALGIYSLGITVIGVFGIFMSLGFGNGLVRFIAKYRAEKDTQKAVNYIRNTSIINGFVVLPLTLCFFLFPDFIAEKLLNTPSLEEYIPLFGLMMFVNSFLVLADQTIRGLQEVRKSTIINTFLRLPLKISLVVVLFSWGWGLEAYIIAELLGSLLALILLVVLIKKLIPLFTNNNFKKVLFSEEEKTFNFNVLITKCVVALSSYGDKIILVYYLSTFELGIYSVVLTIATFIPLVLTSVNAIFSPIMSQLHAENKLNDLTHYFQLSGRYVFTLSFPLMVFIFLFSEPIMAVFGDDFKQGGGLLLLIVVGQLINVSMGSVGLMLQMCGLEKPMRNISIASSVASFTLYFVLIDSWGLLGLGVVYIVNQLVLNVACAFTLNKHLKIQLFHFEYLKIIALFLSLFVVCFWVASSFNFITNPLFLAAALVSIYLLFMLLWLVIFGKKELPQILKTINFKS
jgi:O-antigen/teichoic acid export membrane protein